MAYVNLVNQNCVGFTEEAFQRMRDFICKRNGTYDYSATGIGWMLHDSHYTVDEDNCQIGDWFVVKSVGDSGDEDLYFKFKWHEADHINIQGMLYWNVGTDTGYKKYPASETTDILMCDDDLAFLVWIYGDLNQVIIITKPTTTYYGALFGCARDLPYDTTVATCSGALNSGNDISITVDAVPSEWAVDRYLFIRDTAEIDKIKIKTLVGNVITADLAHNFLAGSKLCADLLYMGPYNNRFDQYQYCLINHAEVEATLVIKITSAIPSYCDPDEMNDEPIGESISLAYSSIGYMGKLWNIYEIANDVPGVSSEDVYTDLDSVNWRVFTLYNNFWAMIKEV
jgi:hypothetical protein